MRTKLPTVVLLLLAVLLVVGFTQAPAARPQFEYKFESGCSEKKANELGGQGWELVAIQSPSQNVLVPTCVFRRAR